MPSTARTSASTGAAPAEAARNEARVAASLRETSALQQLDRVLARAGSVGDAPRPRRIPPPKSSPGRENCRLRGGVQPVRRCDDPRDERRVAHQVRDAECLLAGLPGSQDVAGAAQFQVLFGDHEAVTGFPHDREPRPGEFAQGWLEQQDAMALDAAAADAAPQLVQLCQSEPLGVVDDHERRVGYVHTHFDDGGRDEYVDLAGLEAAHDLAALGSGEPAVHERHGEPREFLLQLRRHVLGRLGVERFGFLDERAHPIGLPALAAGRGDPLRGLGAAGTRRDGRNDRLAPGRQFVDDRHVHVCIHRHRQRPRNGGRGHDELVRQAALAAQQHALMHAEAVLLVDDREAEGVELDRGLEQRVRAHGDERFAGGDCLEAQFALLCGHPPGEQGDIDAEGREPGREALVVLLGEDLRRRHDGGLPTVLRCSDGGEGGDNGLAGSDIALQQAHHRLFAFEVLQDFRHHATLRAGEGKSQVAEQFAARVRGTWAGPRRCAGRAAPAVVASVCNGRVTRPLRCASARLRRSPALRQPGGDAGTGAPDRTRRCPRPATRCPAMWSPHRAPGRSRNAAA